MTLYYFILSALKLRAIFACSKAFCLFIYKVIQVLVQQLFSTNIRSALGFLLYSRTFVCFFICLIVVANSVLGNRSD